MKTCNGPCYYADQGIEVCEACGGCLCCDHKNVDHSQAIWRCETHNDECFMKDANLGRPHRCGEAEELDAVSASTSTLET